MRTSSPADALEDTSLDAANLQYGAIGQALYEQLPAFLKQQKRKQKDGTFDYIGALAEAEDRSGPRDAWVWKMRRRLRLRLRSLSSSKEPRDENHPFLVDVPRTMKLLTRCGSLPANFV